VSEVAEVGAPGELETRQERAVRRTAKLRGAFQTVFETLAEIYRDEDWRYVNDAEDRPYNGFTAFVSDQLGCASSNARRYQQGIVGLILPLQELVAPGARIPVTSADVARLGVAGARVVIEEAEQALQGIADPEEQTDVLRELIDSVAKRSTIPGFGPVISSTVTESPLGALVPAELPQLPAGNAGTEEPADRQGGDHLPDRAGTPDGQDADAHGGAAEDTDETVWVSQSPQPAPAARPAANAGPAPAPGSVIDFGKAEDEPCPPPANAAAVQGLEAAIEAILGGDDPASLAERIPRSVGTHLAADCVAAAQRLARLGQLLRSLAA
jgi:hypothetical protein